MSVNTKMKMVKHKPTIFFGNSICVIHSGVPKLVTISSERYVGINT
jgi:hypothetical protein